MSRNLSKSQQLLYILIQKSNGISDKTKLAKLEYLADFIHYAFNDIPISGPECIYTRQKQGPLSRCLTDDLETLKSFGAISEKTQYNYHVSLNVPANNLTQSELKTIDYVLSRFGNESWSDLMEISHSQAPYLSALEGQVIEYFTAYNLIDDCPDYADKD